jgi:ABC-type branched-subunit amino acid transport system permease subunit
MKSTQMLMYAVVGGTSAVAGPVLGSFVLIGLEEWLRPLQEYVPIFTGVIDAWTKLTDSLTCEASYD